MFSLKCHVVYDVVHNQKCHDVYHEECHEEYDVVVDTTYIEECQDIVTQHCQQTSQQVHHSSAVVGHNSHVVGYTGGHHGKREADADADAQLVRPDLSDGTHIIPIIDCQKNAMLQIIVQMTDSPS